MKYIIYIYEVFFTLFYFLLNLDFILISLIFYKKI